MESDLSLASPRPAPEPGIAVWGSPASKPGSSPVLWSWGVVVRALQSLRWGGRGFGSRSLNRIREVRGSPYRAGSLAKVQVQVRGPISPPQVMLHLQDPHRGARALEALRVAGRLRMGSWMVVEVGSSGELLRRCRANPPAIILMDLEGGPALDHLLQAFPTIPVVLYLRGVSRSPSQLLEWGRRGVAAVVEWDGNDRPSALAELLARAAATGKGEWLLCRVLEQLPVDFHSLFRRAHTEVAAGRGVRLSVERLTWLWRPGAHRSTLAAAFRRHGLPTPGWMVRWIVAFRAAHALQHSGVTVGQVALGMGFESDAALREFLRRLTGLPPSKVTPQLLLRLLERETEDRRAQMQDRRAQMQDRRAQTQDRRAQLGGAPAQFRGERAPTPPVAFGT